MEILNPLVDRISNKFKPTSIFLYGSRARGDANEESDYEVGVIFDEQNYVGRTDLRKEISNSKVSLYPFRIEQLKSNQLDTPFNRSIYIKELSLTAKTLFGGKIVEVIKAPPITVLDVFAEAPFNLGRALSAAMIYREGNKSLASMLFYKSCLFSGRALVIQQTGEFPTRYKDIAEAALQLNLGDYSELIEHAAEVRKSGVCDEQKLYQNISFINQIVMPSLEREFSKENMRILIK